MFSLEMLIRVKVILSLFLMFIIILVQLIKNDGLFLLNCRILTLWLLIMLIDLLELL